MELPDNSRSIPASEQPRQWPARYLLAFGILSIALLLRTLLDITLGGTAPMMVFLPAVFLSAWYCGVGPALLTVLASALSAIYLFMPAGLPLPEVARLVLFCVIGTSGAVFIGRAREVGESLRRKEQEISVAHRQLSEVLESTSDAVYSLDRQWRFTYLNELAHKTLASGRDLVGSVIWEAFPELDHSPFGRAFRRTFKERVPTVTTAFYHPLNTWFESRAYPSQGGGVAVYFRDVSERKRSEDATRASEQRFRTLIEQASDGIFIADNDGRLIEVNTAGCALAGYAREELLGRYLTDFLPREDRRRILAARRQLLAGQEMMSEWHIARKDGALVPVEISGKILPDGRWQSIVRDITQRKETDAALHQSERRFRGTFENAAVGIAHVGLNGEWLRVNGRLCEILGYTREQLLQRTFQSVTHPDDVLYNVERFEQLKRGEVQRYNLEKRYIHSHGHVVWVSLTVSMERAADGRPLYCISFVEDITSRKQLEATLQDLNDDLRQFAYAASHDLQEPLRMVISFTQLLQRRYGVSLDERGRQYIEYAVVGARRMEALLQGLRAYWRASEQDKDPAVVVPVRNIVEEAVLNLETLITETGAQVTSEELPLVVAEPTALVQVFQNLIGNGIKYRLPGRVPHVHISARYEDTHWTFIVRDNGAGIAPEYRQRIFGLFKRLHAFGESGSGIGLALCQKIVERRGGRIWVEASSEEGSTFCFTLPVTTTAAQNAADVSGPAA